MRAVFAPKISHGTPSAGLLAIPGTVAGTDRATGLADGEIPGIHSQGYAPFLWITLSLFIRQNNDTAGAGKILLAGREIS